MLTAIEARWLDYASSVVTCGAEHRQECANHGGTDTELDPSIRYPGTLGSAWDPTRGVLCVSLVGRSRHGEEGPTTDGHDVVDHILEWASSGRTESSDIAFLSGMRAAHERAVPGWDLWRDHFAPVVSELGLRFPDVALTNLAKCRANLDENDGRSAELARLCQSAYPIEHLVGILQPKAVLVATWALEAEAFVPLGLDPIVLCWHGKNFKDRSGRTRKEWLRFEAGRIRRRFG